MDFISPDKMFKLALASVLLAVVVGKATLPRSLDGKIVGGQDVSIEEYPYQVSFQFYDSHFCGASLLRPNVVVTAAHCTDAVRNYPVSYLSVRVGSTIRNQGGEVVAVKSYCQHPKYDENRSYDYDVAVLILNTPVTLSGSVQTIQLQPIGAEVAVGTNAHVSGWGHLESQGSPPDNLQAVEVPKISDSDCARYYPRETITDRMICFGYVQGGKDACQGDSGGPLVIGGKLAGVVSWGYGCADPKQPGVYAKVSNKEVQDFINSCPAF